MKKKKREVKKVFRLLKRFKMIEYKLVKKLSRFYNIDTLTIYEKIKLGYFKNKILEIKKGNK